MQANKNTTINNEKIQKNGSLKLREEIISEIKRKNDD